MNLNRRIHIVIAILAAIILSAMPCRAQQRQDSVRIYFRQSIPTLEMNVPGNRDALNRITGVLRDFSQDSVWTMKRVAVVGGASPEGTIRFNRWLSEQRANALFDYLSAYGNLTTDNRSFTFLGRDWGGLIRLVEDDPNVPLRISTLEFLKRLKAEADAGDNSRGDRVARLKRFKGGRPWKYMYDNLFPQLRSSQLKVWYERIPNPVFAAPEPEVRVDTVFISDTIYECPEKVCRPFYMAAKTNMLFDALLLPNVGVEFYLGKNWSLSASWMYAWWKCDHKHNYWRCYGGDIELRKWFGGAAAEKPLTGHHAGVYAQMYTYDFELGHKGYLAPKWSYGAGVSYGYSLPVSPRLNIDFGISVGYQGGTYKEYKPIDDCYVWQATKKRHYFGPTKAEISLVWLIGCDNINRGKQKNNNK